MKVVLLLVQTILVPLVTFLVIKPPEGQVAPMIIGVLGFSLILPSVFFVAKSIDSKEALILYFAGSIFAILFMLFLFVGQFVGVLN